MKYLSICFFWVTVGIYWGIHVDSDHFLMQVQLWRMMRALTAFTSLRGTGLAALRGLFVHGSPGDFAPKKGGHPTSNGLLM